MNTARCGAVLVLAVVTTIGSACGGKDLELADLPHGTVIVDGDPIVIESDNGTLTVDDKGTITTP